MPEVRSKLLNPGDILQDSLLSLHNLSERNFPALKTNNSTAGTGSYTLSKMRSRYRIIRSLGFVGFSRTYLLAEDLNRFGSATEVIKTLQDKWRSPKYRSTQTDPNYVSSNRD